jgi:hypothetical protein
MAKNEPKPSPARGAGRDGKPIADKVYDAVKGATKR